MEGEGHGNVAVMASSISHDCKSRNMLGIKERIYLELSASSSIKGPVMKILIEESKGSLNLKATELRLGLPGSESPERGKKLNLLSLDSEPPDENQLFSLLLSKDGIYSSSTKNVVSGNKRGFSDTIKEFSPVKNEMNVTLSNVKSERLSKASMKPLPEANESSPPPAKTQVVGWPPVRSFTKNTIATASKNEGDEKRSPGAFFVKVSMDGAPYLRKVDLRSYSTYQQLSLALEKMFSFLTFGKGNVNEGPGSESKLRASLCGSDYVLTFEDKDGDWMLVGDVPWEMFIESCKRLKIMKGSDAIGSASRAIGEKLKLKLKD